eukprot:GILK01000195.1.p1 GENE.GILK01000195.1~~GILK01000195.1.p1  ORF type:complete len:506 (+),score=89.45 GILK01000195.1:199-1518(+)
MAPFDFYDNQAKFGPISWNFVGGIFMIFSAESELTRKIFNNADKLRLWLIFGAKRILGDNNIAFMHGEEHKELRKQLLPLFNRKALSLYLPLQEQKIYEHIDLWLSNPEVSSIRNRIRDLNMETSLEVFVGPYMNKETRAQFNQFYFQMNEGMICFPINFPGTTLWKAIRAREKLIPMLEDCARGAKARMGRGEEPSCLLDFWMVEQMQLIAEAEKSEGAIKDPSHTSDNEIAFTVLDFLFASQDASTSSLVWIFTLLDEHPEVLMKVREEQRVVRPNNEPIDQDILNQLVYTRQVVKETLRFRAPATFVPHIAIDDFAITEDTTIPKGSIIFPSIWCSHFQGYQNAERFEPERFGVERGEDMKYAKNFLAFGYGPHLCLGREYAVNHLMMFTSIISTHLNWKRHRTANSDEIIFGPTIFPGDGCILELHKRTAMAASA